jgi:NADPH:quinone reductase-like Zn-dependent oxidoreductase
MKVWELPQFGFEHLRLAERPDPQPGPNEILVKISAVSLNYRDFDLLQGNYNPHVKLPLVPVSDAASKVIAVGKSVTKFRVGDRVMGQFRQQWLDGTPSPAAVMATLGTPLAGMLAELAVLPEEGAVAIPSHLNDAEASTLPIAALTAWFALVDDGRLKAGETVLAQGTGGVSIFAAQISAALGARVIITSGSDEKLERVKKLGPFECINYKSTPDWAQEVLRMTSGRGADHILEVAGGDNLRRSLECLAIGGHIAVIGFLEGKVANVPILPVIRKLAVIRGVAVGHRRSFEEMNRAFERHAIHPVIDAVYSFADAPQAFHHMQRGAFGKVVILSE